jgi:hypothetical protein
VGLWVGAVDEAKTQIANNPNSIGPEDLHMARAPAWAKAKIEVAQEMQNLGTEALNAFNTAWRTGLESGLAPSDPALLEAARQSGLAAVGAASGGVTDAFAGLKETWIGSWIQLGSEVPGAMSQGIIPTLNAFADTMIGSWIATGHESVSAYTTALSDAQASAMVTTRTQQLIQLLETAMSPAEQAFEASGAAAIKAVRDGMASNLPSLVAFSRETAISNMQAIVTSFEGGAGNKRGMNAIGAYAMSLLQNGMNSQDVMLLLTGMGASQEVIAGLQRMYPQFFGTGRAAAWKVGEGFEGVPWSSWGSSAWEQWEAAFMRSMSGINAKIKNKIRTSFPSIISQSPVKEGPLRNLGMWGANAADEWVNSFVATFGTLPQRLSYALDAVGATANGSYALAVNPERTMRVESTVNVQLADPDGLADKIGYTADQASRDVQSGAAAFAWQLEHQMSVVG